MYIQPTSFVCTISKFVDACGEGHMTGPTVRLHIQGRKLGAEIHVSFSTPARRVLIIGKGTVSRESRVSSHTAFSSVGYTRIAIVRSLVKMGRIVVGEFVSSLTRKSNSGWRLSRVRELTQPSLMTGHRFDKRLKLLMRRGCLICLLRRRCRLDRLQRRVLRRFRR